MQFLDACWLYGDKEKDSDDLYAADRDVDLRMGALRVNDVMQMHGRFSAGFLVRDFADMWRIWCRLR